MPRSAENPIQTEAREALKPYASLLESVLSVRPRKAMVDIKNTTVAVLDGREIVVGVKDNLARSFGIRMGPGSMENKSERIAWNLGNRTKEAVAPTMYFMAGKTGLSDEVLAQAVLAQAEGLDIATATREGTPEGEQKDVVFLFDGASSKMLRVEQPSKGEKLDKEETIASVRKTLEVEGVRASIKKNDSQAQVMKIGQSQDGKTLVGGEGWTVELPISENVIDQNESEDRLKVEKIQDTLMLLFKNESFPMLGMFLHTCINLLLLENDARSFSDLRGDVNGLFDRYEPLFYADQSKDLNTQDSGNAANTVEVPVEQPQEEDRRANTTVRSQVGDDVNQAVLTAAVLAPTFEDRDDNNGAVDNGAVDNGAVDNGAVDNGVQALEEVDPDPTAELDLTGSALDLNSDGGVLTDLADAATS